MKTLAVISTYKILIVIFIVYVVDWMLYVIYYHSCIVNISLLERQNDNVKKIIYLFTCKKVNQASKRYTCICRHIRM